MTSIPTRLVCVAILVVTMPSLLYGQALQRPTTRLAEVDWPSAVADIARFVSVPAAGPPALRSILQKQAQGANSALSTLNILMSLGPYGKGNGVLPQVTKSSVPVLVPFDIKAFLADRLGGETDQVKETGDYLRGFRGLKYLFVGGSGYDAAFSMPVKEIRDRGYAGVTKSVSIAISGSSVLYDLPDQPPALANVSEQDINVRFPGIRSTSQEGHLRFTFVKFGIPYLVSVDCKPTPRGGDDSCLAIRPVVLDFLRALRVVGGAPQAAARSAATAISRPARQSKNFRYFSPGNLQPGSGYRKDNKEFRGSAEYIVYSDIRFPVRQAPSFANSQEFLHRGNCYAGEKFHDGRKIRDPYNCPHATKTLLFDETESENYDYPWRDNFCEVRGWQVGRCPGGFGHQGQDIRPGACVKDSKKGKCLPNKDDVVAVRDGTVLREKGRESLYLVVNSPTEHLRFRYLHMLPEAMDKAGLYNDGGLRTVLKEGEIISKMSNFLGGKNGTTYHLHFDIQVPTKIGWVFVNPYVTLITSYERLIGARGREIKSENIAAD
jgi:hypothetical protein